MLRRSVHRCSGMVKHSTLNLLCDRMDTKKEELKMLVNKAIRQIMKNEGITLQSMAFSIGKKKGNDVSA